MFLTNAQLKSKVAAALKQTPAGLDSYWDDIIRDANVAAYQDIVGGMLARGFTKAQIDDWDRGAEFQGLIGTFHALTIGGALDSFSDAQINKMDRRGDLKTVQVFISGEWVKPTNTASGPGMCGSGSFATDTDTFVPIDDDDPNLGEVTRW